MAAVLSRTSKSLNDNCPTAKHELALTNTMCQQASRRIKHNISSLTSGPDIQIDQSIVNIAKEITQNGGVVSIHPLRV
jgi:hypothetical protein